MSMVTEAPDVAAATTILQLSGGAVLPRCLHAIANLGVADALGETPQPAPQLASSVGAHPEALSRALRLLAANGVFTWDDGVIGHTAASRLLRADHPQSMRSMARMFGLPMMWKMVGEIEYSIRTGQPSGEYVFEAGTWGELARNPEANRVFDESMTAKAHSQLAGILASYDFSGASTIADIGGGRGHLLRAILETTPTAKGVLFDQPHVVDQAFPAERMFVQAGDFFRTDLPGCEIYLLMEVIHDWDDERARLILTNIRRAAAQGARVLIIESLIPEGGTQNWPLTLDLWMLNISGKQRSLDEYAALLASAGFTYTRRVDTPVGLTIVEGVAA